jgi:hypothetical protein
VPRRANESHDDHDTYDTQKGEVKVGIEGLENVQEAEYCESICDVLNQSRGTMFARGTGEKDI